jgi:lysophospholipase L1-like esterase
MKISAFLLPFMAAVLLSFTSDKKKVRVVFFGDSITEAGFQKGGYIDQIRDSLSTSNLAGKYELIGAGISGNKVYDLYLRLEPDVLAKKPQVVVVYVGVNDVWHKQTHGTGTDADKFKKFYDALITRFHQRGIRVVMCTPACIGEKKNGVNPLDKELDTYSDIIRNLAGEKGCPVADLRKAFTDYNTENNESDRYSSILTTDGVHLNTKGNQLVATLVWKQVQLAMSAPKPKI